MKPFIHHVAKSLLEKYGNNLANVTVVFPNKRASLFLNEELILQSGNHAIWSPAYLTISELFRQNSNLVVADNILLVCELYKHYIAATGTNEELDDFFGWGELMLSDFDDLDKNMGDASLIFENTEQLHDYDDASYLTEEQREVLKRFFSNLKDAGDSTLRNNFTKLWNNLFSIYSSFRQSLANKSLAYEGMLYRDVVERNAISVSPNHIYVFVGFNLLQKAEQKLFETIAREAHAEFYWDYDNYYMNDNEAGKYIKQNMQAFPNELAGKEGIYDNFHGKSNISFVASSTDDAQMRYVSQWLTPERIKAGKRTAIVLCDETQLPTVMHCLPGNGDTDAECGVTDVNITTGYPLSHTPATTLINNIFAIKAEGYSKSRNALRLSVLEPLMRHPYMKFISPNSETLLASWINDHTFYPTLQEASVDEQLNDIFTPLSNPDDAPSVNESMRLHCEEILSCIQRTLKTTSLNIAAIIKSRDEQDSDSQDSDAEASKTPVSIPFNSRDIQLVQESIYRLYQIVGRVLALVQSGELIVSVSTMKSLLYQIIRSSSVPFHGEPIMGIQVMGILETRNLDFDHVLLLSCNEGMLPKTVNDASFIPHAVRHAHSLTTIDNKVAIFAYYFYRLLQRAGDVTITYNDTSSNIKRNEMSRFMLQIMAESKLKIQNFTLTSELEVTSLQKHEIAKDKNVVALMESMKHISPTALNNYLSCQLRFFYRHVCGIKDSEDDLLDDEIDNKSFGTIFHRAMELLYLTDEEADEKVSFKPRVLTRSFFEAIEKDPSKILRTIDRALCEKLFNKKYDSHFVMPELDGLQLINRDIIIRLVKNIVSFDKENAPITLLGLEKNIKQKFTLQTTNGPKQLNIIGVIDRLDCINIEGNEYIRVIDYKTGSKSKTLPSSIEDMFKPQDEFASPNKHGYYLQTLLYCLILSSMASEKAIIGSKSVAPALLYPAFARENGYSPILKMDKAEITDASVFYEEFMSRLQSLLNEIFDYTKPFRPTSQAKQCEKCFYRNFCGKKS